MLQGGIAISSPVPVIAPIDYKPDSTGYLYQAVHTTWFIAARNIYVKRRFEFGYGILFSKHVFDQYYMWRDYGSLNYIDRDSAAHYINYGIGSSLSVYYRVSRRFYVGILYQPQFFSVQDGLSIKYEHTLNIDLQLRECLNKFRIRTRFSKRL